MHEGSAYSKHLLLKATSIQGIEARHVCCKPIIAHNTNQCKSKTWLIQPTLDETKTLYNNTWGDSVPRNYMRTITIKEIQETALKIPSADGKPLTMKQAGFIKTALETNEPATAAKENYNIGNKHRKGTTLTEREIQKTAAEIAHENMNKPKIKETIDAIAERVGLTREFVIGALQEDIEAKPRKRARELELAGKWLQLEKPPTTNILNLGLSDEQADRLMAL